MQFDASIGRGEAPFDAGAGQVALRLPQGDATLERGLVGNALVQVLPGKDRELNLRHVQPAAMLRRVMDLQLVREAFGLRGRKGLIQRRGGMGVQVVHHQHDALRAGIVDIDQLADHMREVDGGALVRHRHMPPPPQRFGEHEQVGDAVAHVLVVLPCRQPRCWGQRRADLADELLARFIEADLREARVVGPLVDGEDILHLTDEGGTTRRRQAPAGGQPRLEDFKMIRTARFRMFGRELPRETPADAGVAVVVDDAAENIPAGRCGHAGGDR